MGIFKKAKAEVRVPENAVWEDWKPGNSDAASISSRQGWLNEGLQQQGIRVEFSQEVDLIAIEKIISEELAKGSAEATYVKRIKMELNLDKELAKTLGHFGSALATIQSSMRDYLDSNVKRIKWLGGGCCEICDANDGEVIEIGKLFSSGHRYPPACSYCICDVSPNMDL